MDLIAIAGLILIVLALVHQIPLTLGLILGVVLILIGGAPRARTWW